jgi:hypothetical protein
MTVLCGFVRASFVRISSGFSPHALMIYLSVSNSSVTSACLIILVILESGISAEPTLITSRTSSTDTLAKQTLAPNQNWKEARFNQFWRKKP